MTAHSRLWARALPILAAYGLEPSPDGFDVTDLTAYVQERGWQSSTERIPQHGRGRRWRATIFVRAASTGGFGIGLSGNYGHGSTEDEALAIALAGMIRRDARRP